MLNIAAWHPQVVHFVIALAFVGVGARVVSIFPIDRFRFTNAMATALIVMAAIAGVIAAESGTDAHDPVERVPGARPQVQDHEEAGKLARNLLIGLALLELVTLAASNHPKAARGLRIVAALGGIGACYAVYDAGLEGGVLVYNYAGGIGLRSGDTADVRRLLVAALYHDAMRERDAGHKADAARLMTELGRQMAADTTVKFLEAESMIKDQNNPRGALAALDSLTVPPNSPRILYRKAILVSDAYVAAGVPDSARIVLTAAKAKMPAGPMQQRVQQAIDKIGH